MQVKQTKLLQQTPFVTGTNPYPLESLHCVSENENAFSKLCGLKLR